MRPPALFAVLTATAALGFYRLGARSIWFDEGYSVALTRLPWSGFWHQVTTSGETNSAAYYALLKLWTVVGDSEGTVRSLSVVAAVASVAVVYALGHKLFDARVALFGALFMGSNALLIRQAQEARSYAWVTLLAAGAVLLFVLAVRTPKRRYWMGCSVTAAVAVYFHALAVFVPAVFAVAWWAQGPGRAVASPWKRRRFG